ncbi:hypothetical protein BAE44_0022704 [Dichanthelium oligosanthes]|uniref:Uncharacterized protein n=1 Tax=Dichanthelium oligosanthes TaxID=888268 RepID=A0A1E5UTT9_9POAL|nr:hypothetical protein BAE44_0022704 [Dichanthelium oligosanthes]
MFGGEEEQQPSAQGSEFVETEYGLLPSEVAQINVQDWIDRPEMFEGEEKQGQEQQSSEPEQGGKLVETPSDGVVALEVTDEPTVEELLDPETTSGEGSGMPAAVTPPDDDFFVGVDGKSLFGVQEEEQRMQQQVHSEEIQTMTRAKDRAVICSYLLLNE